MPRTASHFARGKEIVTFPFTLDGTDYRLGPMICYEDILPGFGRELAGKRPHLLVNITNDAWFGDTSEPWQHLALSVFRAVEARADLVRAVNTGVSAFIDAGGRVRAKTYAVDPLVDPRGVDGIVGDMVLMEAGHTFYTRFGDVFGYGCVAATGFLWLLWPWLARRRDARAAGAAPQA
jgi:apolipoprotein N-acyltransferase